MKEFRAFSVLVTENCNLACKYCYEALSTGHRDIRMSKETAIQSVKFMFDQAKTTKDISLTFFGGEPTLMPDIIDIMCVTGKKLSLSTGIGFNVGIITNATVMNEKLYNIIKKHLDIWSSTQLSVDGPHDIQDEYRVTKQGNGTFDTIEKNLSYWKSLFPKTLNVHGVLNKKSIPRLFESYKYFKDIWKEDSLWFLPAKDSNYIQEDVDIYDRELGKIYDYVMDDVRKTKSLKEVQAYAPLDRSLNDYGLGKPCGAGEAYCTITAKGDIYPCHHFYYIDENKEMYLGNVYDGVIEQRKLIWDEYDQGDMIGCDGCDHNACYRCPAENYEEYGNPFKQIKGFHCGFMKIDLKYQKMIRKELIDMGLIKKCDTNQNNSDCKQNDSSCLGNVNDCVGKQGDCDVVVSVNDCKFDRGEVDTVKPFDEVNPDNTIVEEFSKEPTGCSPSCDHDCEGCCSPDKQTSEQVSNEEKPTLKDVINDVIEVLVKYHNKL